MENRTITYVYMPIPRSKWKAVYLYTLPLHNAHLQRGMFKTEHILTHIKSVSLRIACRTGWVFQKSFLADFFFTTTVCEHVQSRVSEQILLLLTWLSRNVPRARLCKVISSLACLTTLCCCILVFFLLILQQFWCGVFSHCSVVSFAVEHT